jgi:hypothetical protein
MAASHSLSHLPGTGAERDGFGWSTAGWTRTVLDAYTQTMIRSRDERAAFNEAVARYRELNPTATEREARRGVAVLICGDR